MNNDKQILPVMETSNGLPIPLCATSVFNGYVSANLVFAYDRIGLFNVLGDETRLTFTQLVSATNSIDNRLKALINAGITLGLIDEDKDQCLGWTDNGREMAHHIGYFTWSVGGYGNFFRELGSLAGNTDCWSGLRDGSMVALGSDQANVSFMRDIFYQTLDELEFTRIADFGCGNAGRLIEVCKRYSGTTGIGIDIDKNAIRLARENVANCGLRGVVELHCEDILTAVQNPEVIDELADVELVTSFMMLHDLLNITDLRDVLFDRLRAAFPSVKYFVIADTVRMPSAEGLDKLPIFNVGFELLHGYMDVEIHDKSSYDSIFERAGLTIEKCLPFGTPNTYLYVLKV